MRNTLLKKFRKWHRKVAAVLFLFFFLISGTGLLLGWKNLFNKEIYHNSKKATVEKNMSKWLSLDSLQSLASSALVSKNKASYDLKIDRIDIKPGKAYCSFQFNNDYLVSLDPSTGQVLQMDIKRFSWIIKLHEGSILDDLLGTTFLKRTYVSIMGIALIFLTISGTYLWYFSSKK